MTGDGVLVIDTCLEALTVAVRAGSRTTARQSVIGTGHAEGIGPAVMGVLDEAGLAPAAIARVGVTVGPGSFMGARVGISFAGGFALPRRVPTVPMTTLAALWRSAPGSARGAAVIDARRGEVYLQPFGPGHRAEGEPALVDHDTARRRLAPLLGDYLCGSGVAKLFPDRESEGPLHPTADALLEVATAGPPGPLAPLYLRAPDAKPPRPLFPVARTP